MLARDDRNEPAVRSLVPRRSPSQQLDVITPAEFRIAGRRVESLEKAIASFDEAGDATPFFHNGASLPVGRPEDVSSEVSGSRLRTQTPDSFNREVRANDVRSRPGKRLDLGALPMESGVYHGLRESQGHDHHCDV